ncbi:nucleotidyltransferase family protein [Dyella agri]|uniref:Nucleotidyltransferase family protein n=1 Tax=Dyella agri TaxID=1926869 RepID=A0ABW8KBG9_9GAMM
MSHIPPALFVALAELVPDLHVHCVEPWCLIGSAAARLLGAEVTVADIDVLASPADADALAMLWADRRDAAHAPADGDRFRSHFARFRFPGMPVEVMGGLELNAGEGWQAVSPGRLVLAGLQGMAVPVPSLDDQIRIFESFGRDKDLTRAAALRRLHQPSALSITSSS